MLYMHMCVCVKILQVIGHAIIACIIIDKCLVFVS
jgi:hypothetical protein